MRRRAAEYRRPVRRRFSSWIWGLLGLFLAAALVLFIVHHHHEDRVEQSILVLTGHFISSLSLSQEKNVRIEEVSHEGLNFTEEILSATSFSRQLGDQMTLAKAYVIIAKEHNNLQLAWELSSKIRSCQLLLSKAAMRGKAITLNEAQPIVKGLSSLIYKAQDTHYDIATTIITMKSHIQALEERANAATVQRTVFGQFAAEALPKSLHCMHIKLTADWLRSSVLQELAGEKSNSPQLMDNSLYHFCIFSDNVLATSGVVNSTVSNSDDPKQLVFHIVTNGISYGVMQAWFLRNDFKGSTIEVQNIEEFSWLNISYSPVMKQLLDAESRAYYFEGSQDPKVEAKFRNPKYLSLLNHLRFYIPEIYPLLEKVVFLDDDVIVQKDLTPLFSLDLHGDVNGAVETCLEAFHRYYKYLNFSNPIISSKFDPQACGWAFGMNVFDLIAWKKANVTARYHYWQQQNADRSLWKLGTLPPGLLTFYGLTQPLDRRWHVLGLGYDLNIDNRVIESAAVIHFNGNMKPWLKLAISSFLIAINPSEAKQEKKLPSAVVVGTVYCDTCFEQDFSKTSHFISGASVAVECGDGNSKPSFHEEVKTNKNGVFKVHLPFSVSKHVKRIKRCSVKLISSSEPFCAVAATATSSLLQLKSRKQGTHIFSAGFFTFKPLKQPELCNQKPRLGLAASKKFSSVKHFFLPPNLPTLPPLTQDPKILPPLVSLPPITQTPIIPNLPPLTPISPITQNPTMPNPPSTPLLPNLPPLPPLPPLPGLPNLPPLPKEPTRSETTKSSNMISDQKVIHPEFFYPTPPIPFLPSPPPAFGFPPNPLQPPPAFGFPPNPLQPPSLLPPNPLQPPALLPPNPFQPPPPLINLPPIPGLTPPAAPTLPLPQLPIPPLPPFPGIPPASSSKKTSP
ncbi:hypothetical protein HHK36_015530 [Tetracentron sinense]|uniref:Hexosyltransferase n=1 Tax=Tetracentron sinense TaxID=13715 RepID=A0A834Z5B6_TETSI|nr:hypothetical protein HHK36_015530 [Tetracentron sinense]